MIVWGFYQAIWGKIEKLLALGDGMMNKNWILLIFASPS
jgi:hypothetical protein